ncbi:hypothetical protein [uncultured Fusobacterium sp.]|uniref:hypothetical protein n=1 Tax=uncultured Fusobacterium sp. TaxID=159267 RepID=UPI0025F4A11B|nr:hypothetical protein [uncultured Fusobacterium sp.]
MLIEVRVNTEEIVITGDNTGSTGKNGITKLEFIFDSPDDTKEKNYNNIIGVILEGKINTNVKEQILKLAEWATTSESSKIYREVNICVYSGDINSDALREIVLTSAFVVDYQEKFDMSSEDETKYLLTLRQKFDKRAEVKIY